MAGSALRRLMAEYKQMSQNPPDGIAAGPVTEENFFEWEAAITGPEGTYFEDGVFIAQLSFPQDYPLNPPKMKFKSDLFHPNIYPDGRVCISILHPPGADPLGYESSSERWSPVQSIEKILLSELANMSQLVRRQVKPLISTDQGEARLRVLSLYKAWSRHIPIMCKDFDIPRTEAQCQAALRREFLKNARLRDLRVIDMTIIKGQQDLQEVVNHWKQVTHIMAKWFPEDNVEEKPKDFISKFLSGVE